MKDLQQQYPLPDHAYWSEHNRMPCIRHMYTRTQNKKRRDTPDFYAMWAVPDKFDCPDALWDVRGHSQSLIEEEGLNSVTIFTEPTPLTYDECAAYMYQLFLTQDWS